MSSSNDRMFSVIVPVYNCSENIEECLASLINQNGYFLYEIIVVDDGSTDNTPELVRKFILDHPSKPNLNMKLIRIPHAGPAKARNIGVKHAKGDIILFIDSDCRANSNWISSLTRHMQDGDVVGVGGTYRTLNEFSKVARYVGLDIEYRHSRMKKILDYIGTFSACLKREAFEEVGGFDEGYILAGCEDNDLSYKMRDKRYKLIYEPEAWVWHIHPSRAIAFFKGQFKRAMWRVHLYSRNIKWMKGDNYAGPETLIQPVIWAAAGALSLIFLIYHGVLGLTIPLGLSFVSIIILNARFIRFSYRKEGSVVFSLFCLVISIIRSLCWTLGGIWGALYFLLFRRLRKHFLC